MSALAATHGDWRAPQRESFSLWSASFLLVLAAHLLTAILLLNREASAPDGGNATPEMAIEMTELQLYEALGDNTGASEIVSPGEQVEVAGEAETAEPIETVHAEVLEPTTAEVLDASRAEIAETDIFLAESVPPVEAEASHEVATEIADPVSIEEALEPLEPTRSAAMEFLPDETLPPVRSAEAVAPSQAKVAEPARMDEALAPSEPPLSAATEPAADEAPPPLRSAEAVAPSQAEIAEPARTDEALAPSEPPSSAATEPVVDETLPLALAERVDAVTASELAEASSFEPAQDPLAPLSSLAPVAPDPLAAIQPPPAPEVSEAEELMGEITESTDVAALPRPRPETVPEAFMREYERQVREAEERRVVEANRRAETRRAEQRRAERRAEQRRVREPAERDSRERAAPAPRRAESRASGAGAAGAAPRDPGAGRAATASYQDRVYAQLQRRKRFPSGERRGGVVTVGFSVAASGAASGIRLVRGSGNPIIDQAALDLVRRASPFPPIPPEVGRSSLAFVVPIDYSVR